MNLDSDDAYSELLQDLASQDISVRCRAIDDVVDCLAPLEAVELLLPLVCEYSKSGSYAAYNIACAFESSGPNSGDPDGALCLICERVVREICALLPGTDFVKKASFFRILECASVKCALVEETLTREVAELARARDTNRGDEDTPYLDDAIAAGIDALRAIGQFTPETARIVRQLSAYRSVKVRNAVSDFENVRQGGGSPACSAIAMTGDSLECDSVTFRLVGNAESRRVAALRRLRSTQLFRLGRRLMQANEMENAVELFKRSVRLRPHGKTFELLGECFVATGALVEAVEPLAAATALRRHARPAILLAEVFARLDETSLARDAAMLAIEREPQSRKAKELLAVLCKKYNSPLDG